MISKHREVPAIQIGAKLIHCPHQRKALTFSGRIILLMGRESPGKKTYGLEFPKVSCWLSTAPTTCFDQTLVSVNGKSHLGFAFTDSDASNSFNMAKAW